MTPNILDAQFGSKTIRKTHDMVLTARRLKVRETVKAIVISHDSGFSISQDDLTMRKVFSIWKTRLLTVDFKAIML